MDDDTVRVINSTDPQFGVIIGDVGANVGYDKNEAYALADAIRKIISETQQEVRKNEQERYNTQIGIWETAVSNARTQALDEIRVRIEYLNEHCLSTTHDRNDLYNRILKEIEQLKEINDG